MPKPSIDQVTERSEEPQAHRDIGVGEVDSREMRAPATDTPEAREGIGTLSNASSNVKETVEREVSQVETPAQAERVVEQIEHLTAGKTEQQAGDAAAKDGLPAAVEIQRAVEESPPQRAAEAAVVLTETAKEAAAQTDEGKEVVEAVHEALTPASDEPPEVQRGAALLRGAVLRHMGPLQRLDAEVYLAINNIPHPRWASSLANVVTVWTTGGWVWAGAVLIARLLGTPKAGHALILLLPSMTGATMVVEYPMKAFFRRQRPFIEIVRALVIGKKPGSWSFPSGHTASSFACAWVLSTIWPKGSPLFLTLASLVGFSRIYVGAHYPGDVASGAFLGMSLAELIRWGTKRLLRRAGYFAS
ncbi:MAG TPA: phosphatase PAP2 family protein [Chloroflexota bacterium]|nr:phosphatase PAP2 family protein [Chloroflexota bacterium]